LSVLDIDKIFVFEEILMANFWLFYLLCFIFIFLLRQSDSEAIFWSAPA